MFHPVHTYIGKFVTNFTAQDLHETIFENGVLVYDRPRVQEIQSYTHQRLDLLWEEYKRSLNPEEFPVNLSQACWDNKMKRIDETKKQNQNPMLV